MSFLIFPNQLYEEPVLHYLKTYKPTHVILMEEPIYFYDPIYKPFRPNKVKLAYLRASMKYFFKNTLQKHCKNAIYVDYSQANHKTLPYPHPITAFDPIDHDVKAKYGTSIIYLNSPDLMIPLTALETFYKKYSPNKSIRHATFYEFSKKHSNIFTHIPNQDKYNRDPPPTKPIDTPYAYKPPKSLHSYYQEAIHYINTHPVFKILHYGDPSHVFIYPITHKEALKNLNRFLTQALPNFGRYQDAVMKDDPFMYHSIISPALNNGLLLPSLVIKKTMEYYAAHSSSIPTPAIEGFMRQVIGWRPYMQSLYIFRHQDLIHSNTAKNYNTFKDPSIWYKGETGITPLDSEIKKAMQFGYAHHIVRLMIFMNFFILCELHPYEIYKWFMEVVSIDAYSWVMESNIYAMGYFYPKAMTKPYLSTSHYIAKMTNYKKDGHWDKIWDALYHSFIKHKPSNYTFFYKRTLKADKELDVIANEFKTKHFKPYKDS